jgi:hypothetical protein
MKRWISALGVAALVVSYDASAQVPAPPPRAQSPFVPARLPPPPRGTGGIVIGQVIDVTTGRGVPSAIVRLEGRSGVVTRLTDDRGRFFFKNLAPGEFQLTAERRGFLEGQYGRGRAGGEGTPLVLYENQWMIDVQLPVFRPATISGLVLDDGSEPVIGARVQAFLRRFETGRWHYTPTLFETTDDQGAYRISGLPAGEYVVAVQAAETAVPVSVFEAIALTGSVPAGMSGLVAFDGPLSIGLDGQLRGSMFDADGKMLRIPAAATPPPPDAGGRRYVYPTTFHPGSEVLAQALSMTIATGEMRTGVTFHLRPSVTSRVTGFVIGPGGPVAHQLLRLVVEGTEDFGTGFETVATMTDDLGAFTFPDVPIGNYTILARSALSTRLMAGADPSIAPVGAELILQQWGRQAVSVGFDDVNNVIVVVRPGATLDGMAYAEGKDTLTSEQVGRIGINVESTDGQRLGIADGKVGPTGAFRISGLPHGRYRVRVSSLPLGWHLKSALADGVDVSETPLVIGDGRELPPIFITITNRGTSVIGTVRDIRGQAVGGATIVAFPASYKTRNDDGISAQRLRSARANASGVYQLAGLPPGEYLFAAINEATSENWQAPESLERLAGAAARVTLRDAEPRTIDVKLAGTRR